MSFLAGERDTKEVADPNACDFHTLGKDSTQYWKGQMVCIDTDDGKLCGATAGDLTIRGAGMCLESVLTGTSNTRLIKWRRGTFYWGNGATFEAVAAAQESDVAFIVDDQTVGKSGATAANAMAGRIVRFSSTYGVAVKMDPYIAGQGVTAGG
jgi:hypothetical protein